MVFKGISQITGVTVSIQCVFYCNIMLELIKCFYSRFKQPFDILNLMNRCVEIDLLNRSEVEKCERISLLKSKICCLHNVSCNE